MHITQANQLLELKENEFIGELPKFTNLEINFNGKNNILVCEDDVHLWNSRIDFNLDNSALYLSSNIHDYSVNIALHKDNVCFIGKNNFFNGRTNFVLSEAKNIILGDDCFISYAPDDDTLDVDDIEANLNGLSNPDDIVEYMVATFFFSGKNRFSFLKESP